MKKLMMTLVILSVASQTYAMCPNLFRQVANRTVPVAAALTTIKTPRAIHRTDSSAAYSPEKVNQLLLKPITFPLLFAPRYFSIKNLNEQTEKRNFTFLKDMIYGLIYYETGMFPEEIEMVEMEIKRKMSLFGGKK